MKTFIGGLLSVFLFSMIVAVVGAFLINAEIHKSNNSLNDTTFMVDKGSPVSGIATDLKKRNIISEDWLFIIGTKFKKADTRLRAGEYLIPAKSSIVDIIDILVSGTQKQYPVTVPEGLNSYQIIGILNGNPNLTGEIGEIPKDGTLFPETYYFTKGTDRNSILKRMQNKMQKLIAEEWRKRNHSIPIKSLEEAMVLASIIEKETGINSERKKVAGVFINRLNKGMKLQTDPTVIYAVTDGGKKPLKRKLYTKDLEKPHPYNTYHIHGLPPAPICHPGYESIVAALHPEKHDFLYFVANGKGGHSFAKTLAGHNKNVAEWRKLRKK